MIKRISLVSYLNLGFRNLHYNFRTPCPFLTSTKNLQNEKVDIFVSRKGYCFAIFFLRIIQTSMHFKLRGIRSPEFTYLLIYLLSILNIETDQSISLVQDTLSSSLSHWRIQFYRNKYRLAIHCRFGLDL